MPSAQGSGGFFSQSGIAGLVCYGGAVFCIVLFVRTCAACCRRAWRIARLAPLAAIFLKEPLERLIERKQHIFPEGSKVMFFLEAFVELFDVVLSYATNSISFVRVGAFALSHAGMMGVVLTLAGYESGETNWLYRRAWKYFGDGIGGACGRHTGAASGILRNVRQVLSGNGQTVCIIFSEKRNGREKNMAVKIILTVILVISMGVPYWGIVWERRRRGVQRRR